GDDLREGKCTLPLIAAMQCGTPEQASIVRHAIEQGSTDQLDAVVDIVRSTGALDIARAAAHDEAHRAIKALEALPNNAHTANLRHLAGQRA
ncbi:MAG: octaprenyl diphosphate synthase, partial [Janthinobacterium sp.]